MEGAETIWRLNDSEMLTGMDWVTSRCGFNIYRALFHNKPIAIRCQDTTAKLQGLGYSKNHAIQFPVISMRNQRGQCNLPSLLFPFFGLHPNWGLDPGFRIQEPACDGSLTSAIFKNCKPYVVDSASCISLRTTRQPDRARVLKRDEQRHDIAGREPGTDHKLKLPLR